MSMDTKMADSVESVLALIKNLSGKAKQGQETELEEMQSYANSRAFDGDIDVFDIEYFRVKSRALQHWRSRRGCQPLKGTSNNFHHCDFTLFA